MLEDLIVAHSVFRPAFQHSINPDAFPTLKLLVFEIGVMNHLGDSLHCLVPNAEPSDQCLERAVIAVMRGFDGTTAAKTNFARGSMNLRINQAEPTRSISGRGRVSHVLPR